MKRRNMWLVSRYNLDRKLGKKGKEKHKKIKKNSKTNKKFLSPPHPQRHAHTKFFAQRKAHYAAIKSI